MMPTPTHLAYCTKPLTGNEEKKYKAQMHYPGDMDEFVAYVVCPCGNDVFEILYPGETQEWANELVPCTIEIDNKFFFLVQAKCDKCGQEHLLFDQDFHGWNGWICHDPEQASSPRPALVAWQCTSCNCSRHKAIIVIDTQGKEDFMEEAGEEFDDQKWQDAFDYFALDVVCECCGKRTESLIACETM